VKRLLLIPLLAACDGTEDVLEAAFVDEVVGAPARSTEVAFLDGTTCSDLLTVPADAIDQLGARVLSRRTAGFPIHPDEMIFENVPRGQPLVIHVVAFDVNGVQVGRGCIVTTLAPEGPLSISVPMLSLPNPEVCGADWRYVSVALVLDTTVDMAVTYSGNEHIDAMKSFVDSMEEGTRFSIITHGHTSPPAEYLPPTADQAAVLQALEDLRGLKGGSVELFNGVALAARLLRSRAVCRHRPVILALEAGVDVSPTNEPVAEAQIGLYASVGDATDDIFLFGIYGTREAQSDLLELTDDESLGQIDPGIPATTLPNSLLNARFAFDGLIVR
jgi:hypothetical protein